MNYVIGIRERVAGIIKARARERIGEISGELDNHQGERISKDKPVPDNGTGSKMDILASACISTQLASDCEAIAAIPEEEFEAELERAAKSNKMITSAALVRKGRKIQRENLRQKQIKNTPKTGGDIITGDLGLLFDLVPDETADLFFTDPPYHDIHIYTSTAP